MAVPRWYCRSLGVGAATGFFGVLLAFPSAMVAQPAENGVAEGGSRAQSAPDFSGVWQHHFLAEYQAVPGQPSPVRDIDGPLDPFNNHVVFNPDYTNPNLKPWAAAYLEKVNEFATANDNGRTYSPQETCRPLGVPAIHLLGGLQILQMPDQVTMLWQGNEIRQVYLDRDHSEDLTPTGYGESVGRYEGDTLVIDTIGLNDQTTLDFFSTPHSEALHVVERLRLVDGGQRLEVEFTVDDPNTFHEPWTARMYYTRSDQRVLQEMVCAENNRLPAAGGGFYSIPMAAESEPRY